MSDLIFVGKDKKLSQYIIVPNPVFTSAPQSIDLGNSEEEVHVSITDNKGKIHLEKSGSLESINSVLKEVAPDFGSGFYLVSILTRKGLQNLKLLVSK